MSEKQKEYARNYYLEHKEYFKERQKEWRMNNPEKWRELCRKNRKKRIDRLRESGVLNPYDVVNKRADARYREDYEK